MHPYYYIRNGQGDVIGLFDANGNVVARYSYDSWGNLLKITDGSGNDKTNDTTFIGCKNPLRYRGYYYDSETKLYYLQSRYYKPEWGRFINADGFVNTGLGLTGTNMFAYCNNNPVMFTDPTGYCSCYGYSPAIMPWSSWERHVLICPTTEHISMPSESMGPPPKETSIIEKGWNTVVGITGSVLNGFQASATGGYGWGLGAEAIVYGVPVSVQGKWVTDGYFMIEDGQYMSGNRYGWDISTQIGPFNWTQGYYEPYNVTAGPVPDHINNDITFGFGVCGYLGIGGSLSLKYNISRVWQNSFEVIQEIWG